MKASSAAGNSANSATAEALTGQPPPAPYPQATAEALTGQPPPAPYPQVNTMLTYCSLPPGEYQVNFQLPTLR